MVKMLFEGKNLANCDFWTKSDPYLILSRPKKGDHEFKKVNMAEALSLYCENFHEFVHFRLGRQKQLKTI